MFLNNVDFVPSNVQFSHQEALLHVFEDSEAVIKMITKGRSLTMRHVSRTHRVALDWLFDRINLDPQIQIKYIDTENQLADMLTKGNFTRDEWHHLLCLFNVKKNTRRIKWRKSHSKVKTNDECDCKGSLNSVTFGIRKPGEEKLWKSESLECESWGICPRTAPGYYHEQFTERSFSARYSKCKEYTSKYRKFYAIWLRRKRQQQHEQWD